MFLSKRTPPGSARTPGRTRAPEITAQDGLTLIEVIISSMLVALIAIGTLTGFANAGKTTSEAGTHSQATVCAQQDEERLRGMNSEALANLGSQTSTEAENCQCVESVSGAWRYCSNTNLAGQSYKGTVFTLSTSVTPHTESSSGASETCTVESGTISYLRTTTQVKWSGLGERHPVSQSSIVTTPLAAALEIKVHTENLEPVEGAEVTMTSNGTNFTQTTGSTGCVIFGYVNANSVEVKAQKTGYVEPDGNTTPSKTISISADTLTTKEFILNQGGAITAEFEFKGAKVEGDTFVAYHTGMITSSNFDQEGTLGTYSTKVTTPSTLYPFVTLGKPAGKSEYTVYAGDCEANNPETVTSKAVAAAKAQVEPGGTTSVKVPVAPIKIEVWSGTTTSHGSLVSGKATLTNTGCEKATPNNYLVSGTTIPSTWVHPQNINTSGKLEHEYQPFGTFSLCVTNGSKKYTTTASNNKETGVTVSAIYLGSVGTTGSSCP